MVIKRLLVEVVLFNIIFTSFTTASDFVDSQGRYWHETYNGYVDDYGNVRNDVPIQQNGNEIITSSGELVYTPESYYGIVNSYTSIQPQFSYIGMQNGIPIYIDSRGNYYAYYRGRLIRI